MKTPGNLALRRQLASSYLQAQAPAKALDVLTKVDGATLDADAVRLLIAASREAETERATRARVDALLESRREHHEIVAFLAQYLAATGELDAARRVLARAIETAPDDPALRLASAEIALSLGDRAGAASQLEAVRRADPKAVHARLLLARMALDRDDAKAAEALVTEALASAPAVAPARNAAGLLYLTTARYDDAAAHFRAGTVAEPANALLWLNLGRAQLGLGQSDAARNSLLQALQFNPRWLPAEGALAFLELDEGHPGAALARIAALREADPKNADVLMLEGELLGALRRYADAERAFQAAAALRPSALAALRIYQVRAAGQQPNAAEPLQSWVRAQPEDLGMRMALAQAHASAGQRKLAAEQYEYIVARAPRDVTSLNNLAWLYFELKDPRSLELARKAHALAPDAAAVADTLGWILVQSGRQAEGLGVLERAASTGAGGDVEYHYAFALARSGRQAEAVTRLRRLLEAPDSFSSREEASRLLASLDK
jgi:putative PEP-CTERM system TPR-repeat lipoprotein